MPKATSRSTPRDRLLVALDEAIRKVGAQAVLISDLVATRVGINSTELECLHDEMRAGGVASTVCALEPTAPDDAGLQLDQNVQAFKDEVIQFNRDAVMAEEAFLYPPQTRVTVYLSTTQRNLLLDTISVTLDDKAPVVYKYGDIYSRELLVENALQRLIITNMDRGQHLLSVSYNGNYV